MIERDIKEKIEYCLNCKTKPCTNGCPLNNNIPDFIQSIKSEKYKEAYEILNKTTVLSSICGRICPHIKQCEGACVRGIKGKPVSIGELEAFVGDIANENGYLFFDKKEKNKKKVAIIGSGPASLTCAAFLRKEGYDVTIFEKREKLGGILRYGIPRFRLDEKVLDDTIDSIINLGIDVKTNCTLGHDIFIDNLQKNYNAIFIGTGANISSMMGIEGENLKGVYGGNELLEYKRFPDFKDKKVAVIGGGNVAIDSAREIKRLGAGDVTIIYRRAEKQMPAEEKEIQATKDEDINFLFQTNVVKIIGDNKVEKLECIKTKLIKKEGEKREVPVDIENSNYIIDMDYVVMAIGSKPDKKTINSLRVELDDWGYIKIDENHMTSKKGIFAGGDIAGEKKTVAWAARSGREAAYSINKYLK